MPRTELPSHDDFVEHVLDAVRAVGTTFEKPTDDWDPIAHFIQPYGDGYRAGIGQIPPMVTPRDQQMVLDTLVNTIKRERVAMMSMIVSTWITHHPIESREQGEKLMRSQTYEEAREIIPDLVPPRDNPDSDEAVCVMVFSKELATVATAEIIRTDHSTPHLADWDRKDMTDLNEGVVAGMWAKPLYEAVRSVA